jgi:hypothetical protein
VRGAGRLLAIHYIVMFASCVLIATIPSPLQPFLDVEAGIASLGFIKFYIVKLADLFRAFSVASPFPLWPLACVGFAVAASRLNFPYIVRDVIPLSLFLHRLPKHGW